MRVFSKRARSLLTAPLLLICGLAGCAGEPGAYFRFTLAGEEYVIDGVELSISRISTDGRFLFLIYTPPAETGPEVNAVWRMSVGQTNIPEEFQVTERGFAADASSTFMVTTDGQAGAGLGDGSSLTITFKRVSDDIVEGSFGGSALIYSESFSSRDSRLVDVSGTFRIPVDISR